MIDFKEFYLKNFFREYFLKIKREIFHYLIILSSYFFFNYLLFI